ncbi:MAG: hypothetical protein AB7D38_12315, partial [Sulfurimonas sp.]|uniref:hypothetical protein n=1 Tax=Sulfurimonas sp. TaxID=2022749 RepID=UPI003D108820
MSEAADDIKRNMSINGELITDNKESLGQIIQERVTSDAGNAFRHVRLRLKNCSLLSMIFRPFSDLRGGT